MNIKPSPMQARALKALNAQHTKEYNYPRIDIHFHYTTGKIQYVYTSNMVGQKIAIPTIKVLLKNGWIEKKEEGYEYYIISEKGRAALEGLTDNDFVSTPAKKPIWKTHEIVKALNLHYEKLNKVSMNGTPKWIYFDELRNERWASSIVDFWAMSCWSGYDRISYEIKISRGDFLKEIKNPDKRKFGMEISKYFYYISPPDLIKTEEVPENCGLIELSETGKLRTIVKAPIRFPNFKFTWDFAACLGRKTFIVKEKRRSGKTI